MSLRNQLFDSLISRIGEHRDRSGNLKLTGFKKFEIVDGAFGKMRTNDFPALFIQHHLGL